MSSKSIPYHGETICEEDSCNKRAYWLTIDEKKACCGAHSKKRPRDSLPKNPKAAEERAKRWKEDREHVDAVAKENKEKGIRGKVVCEKMKMMKTPTDIPGYLKVFPNYKHQNRRDGFGCSDLSPKKMGPIEHREPGMPVALNLENFHQGSKVFPHETSSGDPNFLPEKAWGKIKEIYQDPEPHRHKYSPDTLRKHGKNVNIPLFSVHIDSNGNAKPFTYLQSRYFYCKWYEHYAKKSESFAKLVEMLNDGYNLQIVGYDAYAPDKDLHEHYLDTSRPFGHEMVLYTLLTVENTEEYPWNKYRSEHLFSLYDNYYFPQ